MFRRQFLRPRNLTPKLDSKNQESSNHVVSKRTNTGLAAYTGSWTDKHRMHLLRRTTFGPSMSDYKSFKSKSMSECVASLLDLSNVNISPPVNNYHNSIKDPNVDYGKTWVDAPFDGNLEGRRKNSLKSWLWSTGAAGTGTIFEKMWLFWHNHFATEMNVVPSASASYYYFKTLKDNALGNFKELTRAVTLDPAMLYYLNGRLNTKNAPDENYARELQELFTLGKGADSKFNEDDVKAAARVLTGFTIDFRTTPFTTLFLPNKHDTDDKEFSDFFGNTVIKGRSDSNGGYDELDDLLDMIFSVEEVSKFICRRLYRYFVYYEIDSNAESNVIEPLAKVFRDNNFDIKPVLQTLLSSEHFYDSWNQACLIKDPFSHTAGYIKQFQPDFPPSNDIESLYKAYSFGWAYTTILQMDLGDPPSVSGWEAWYQIPLYHRIWITSDSLPKRNEYQDYLLWIGHKISFYTIIVNPWTLTKQFDNPSNPDKLIEESTQFLLPFDLSADQIQSLKEVILPGGIPDYNWTDDYQAATDTTNSNHTTALTNITLKLKLLYKAIMNLSEYQLS